MTGQHIVSAFDKDLTDLNHMVSRLGGLAERQLDAAVQALETRNTDNIDAIIAADKELDALEFELNERAIEVIARRSPMAKDLRHIVVALRVAANLERIGDYAKNIAKRSRVIIEQEVNIGDSVSVLRMSELVQQMINKVLDAYTTGDADLAMEVWESDMDVDQLHTSLFREILQQISQDPAHVSSSSQLLFVAKNIERIGDYATGIAEQIYFVKHGVMPDDERPKADNSSSMNVDS
jgi:phosphate transport system protein